MGSNAANDITDELAEIAKADAVAEQLATRKREREQQQMTKRKEEAERNNREAESPLDTESNEPKKESSKKPKPLRPVQIELKDAFVNTGWRILQSHKQRFHRIALRRQLAGIEPHTKQDIMREVMEELLSKWERDLGI